MVDDDNLQKQIQEIEEKLQSSVTMAAMEAEFAERANVTFQNNLQAFKKYLPDIYEQFANFNPKPGFELFLNQDGMANIIDYSTKCPMYGLDIPEQIQKQVDKSLESPIFSKVDYGYLENMENKYDFIHVDLIKSAGVEYNKAKNTLAENHEIDGKIPSIVIFGVGLGYHLKHLLERVPSTFINIFEPEEDYFFASLFTFDWADYLAEVDRSGASLYISIGVSEEETYAQLYSRAQELGPFTISNSFFYQHYPSRSLHNLILKIRDNFHEFFMGWGFIDDAFMSLAHSCANVKQQMPYFHASSALKNRYKDFPVFIVANGPSLDKDIEYIKQVKDQVLIVACNSATTALLKHGIVPDFHAALERSRATYDFLKAFIPQEYREQIALLTVNVMHQDVAGLFEWAGAALKGREAGTSLHQVSEIFCKKQASATLPFCNPLVGNMALSYVVSLGFKNIYLFGTDNGYVDPEHHHSKSSMYYNKQGDTVYQPLQIGSQLKLEGNFGNVVIADHFLYSGKVQMERVLATSRAQDANCFNCSDGAKIEGSISLRAEDIILEESNLSKRTVSDYVKNELFYIPDSDFDLEEHLDFDGFDELCATLIDILEKPVSSRDQAFDQVMEQVRLLISLKETQFSHHYMVLEGEALYLNSILINMLFNYGSSDEILPYYLQLRKVWCDFLRSAPQLYRENWNKASDHVFEV
ncbi:6-hydroxymethylpterin diphosphokinase MptE-like protein [Pseudoalteromonas viridis]|uniref:Motility associated factor glycosyltransferase family protein n=1 Tax=Pseudoalteromonas viridis TaxID=339617 RepID=A0ABX7V692_9GAMM|nr:6-hydroxymethylpterin diphosphokinase MptE-like protein [Pseudoalteromonas viridis]QTL34218.1 motility associated factor glycosyltransferase family protein [Pseudoalteromonas viridis]